MIESKSRRQPVAWTFSIFVALCLIQLTLNFLPAVIMLSHKKEADLVENYSHSPPMSSHLKLRLPHLLGQREEQEQREAEL